VVEKGVNGKPFLWIDPAGTSYVMIDVFEARPDGCYAVLALDANPLTRDEVKARMIGLGCASKRTDWLQAYERAKEIADKYMNKHSRLSA
jgi:hypothetical protein